MNALLILLAGTLLKIVLTGTYLRYVRPALAVPLLAAATAILTLATTSLIHETRNPHDPAAVRVTGDVGAPAGGHGHEHRHGRWTSWLVVVPVLVLFLAAPPALGADSVVRSPSRSAPVPDQHFAPLPGTGVVPMGLSEFVARSVWDTSGTLRGRTVRLTGFVVHEHGTTYLARLVITCCAADATPMTVQLDGTPADALPDNQWITAEGALEPGSATPATAYTPKLHLRTTSPVTPPGNPYEY